MALFVDQCHLIGDAKQVIGGAITRDSGDDWCQTDDRPPASGRKPEQEDRQADADAYHLFSFAHITFISITSPVACPKVEGLWLEKNGCPKRSSHYVYVM